MYRVDITRDAQKQLKSIPVNYHKRILAKIESLAQDPLAGKKLEGEFRGKLAVRVWPYRIIYRVLKTKQSLEILDIAHRQGVYK